MRETGLEPASTYVHMNLNHARLPIPPFPHFGGQGWIRTTEVCDGRFTVCSLWPLGNLPTFPMLPYFIEWSWRWDLNPQPADYKSAALPIELRQPILRSTATPFSIRLQVPHCVGNNMYYTLFHVFVNTLFCLVLSGIVLPLKKEGQAD